MDYSEIVPRMNRFGKIAWYEAGGLKQLSRILMCHIKKDEGNSRHASLTSRQGILTISASPNVAGGSVFRDFFRFD